MPDPATLAALQRLAVVAYGEHARHKKNAQAVTKERRQAHEIIEASLKMNDEEERKEQVRHALPDLIRAISDTESQEHVALKSLHLDAAAAYEALEERERQDAHLNDACDAIVRLLVDTDDASERKKLKAERDEVLELIDDRRTLVLF